MKPAVLYISYTGLTEPLGQSQILNYLIGLSREYDIHILSTEKKQDLEKHKDSLLQICNNHNISWHYVSYSNSIPGLSTITDVKKLKKTAISLHRKYSFKLVHCRSYLSSLVGLHLKRKYNIPFIFDMRGFWADERIEGKLWNINNPLYWLAYRYFKLKEKQFLIESDHIVSLTKNAKNVIESWNMNNAPISYIPTCVNLNLFDFNKVSDQEVKQTKRKLGLPLHVPVLSYVGSLGTWYKTREMLISYKSVLDVAPDTVFLFITRDKSNIINELISTLQLPEDQIIFTSGQPKEMPVLIACSDLSIFYILTSFSKKASAPTKFGEILGMGIPVITNSGYGDVEAIVKEGNCGLVVDISNMNSLAGVGKRLNASNFPSKDDIRSVAEQHFSLEKGIKKYQTIYENLLTK